MAWSPAWPRCFASAERTPGSGEFIASRKTGSAEAGFNGRRAAATSARTAGTVSCRSDSTRGTALAPCNFVNPVTAIPRTRGTGSVKRGVIAADAPTSFRSARMPAAVARTAASRSDKALKSDGATLLSCRCPRILSTAARSSGLGCLTNSRAPAKASLRPKATRATPAAAFTRGCSSLKRGSISGMTPRLPDSPSARKTATRTRAAGSCSSSRRRLDLSTWPCRAMPSTAKARTSPD